MVVANTESVGASLVVWLLAGILGWTGASSFAELGTAIPLNGGPQVNNIRFKGIYFGLIKPRHIWRMHMVPSFHTCLHGQQ